MNKYDSLWKHISKLDSDQTKLSFEEIKLITGVPIDHSFLTYKKELIEYGYKVGKISMKDQTVEFIKIK